MRNHFDLKKLEGHFSGTGEAEEFRKLKARLAEAVRKEALVGIK